MNKYFMVKTLKSFVFFTLIVSTTFAQIKEKTATMQTNNVLLEKWTGPYGGVPSFDKMDLQDIKPALEKGMALNLAEIDAITKNTELCLTC